MSAITQYLQQVALQVFFNVVRLIAGMSVGATDIHGRLHLTAEQMAGLLGVTRQNLQYHLNKVYEGLSTNSSGQMGFANCLNIYQTPVFYPPRADGTGGGGNKQTKFYDLEILLLIAERMENNPRKNAILAEGRAIVAAYHNAGFVVNQHALQTDPRVQQNAVEALKKMAIWPDWRQEVCALHVSMVDQIRQCADVRNPDGTINNAKVNVTARIVHSTLYMAQFGKPAVYLYNERANPNLLSCNHVTHRNPGYPGKFEIRNVTNMQYEDELVYRKGNLERILGYAGQLLRTGTVLTTELYQQIAVVNTWSQFNPPIIIDGAVCFDPTKYPRYIRYVNPNGIKSNTAYAQAAEIARQYDSNFHPRHTWTHEQCLQYAHVDNLLLEEVIQSMNEFGDIVESDNAANYPIDGEVVSSTPNPNASFDI